MSDTKIEAPATRLEVIKVPVDKKPFCCHISDADGSCESDGQIFEIMGQPGHPYDDATHACIDHIGALLGTPVGAEYENKSWAVYPVGGLFRSKECSCFEVADSHDTGCPVHGSIDAIVQGAAEFYANGKNGHANVAAEMLSALHKINKSFG